MSRGIIVGSRGSRLALIQAESVVAKIREVNPRLEISLREISTTGDRDHRTQLDQMEPSVFVKELEETLIDNRIDIAVHSLKDVPTDIPQGLCLLAVTERLDPRDVLISSKGRLDELPPGSRIGTDSLRRAVQLRSYRPDLKVCSIRGNVDTRLRKVAHGEFDGVILAAAAILRLGWQDRITEYLPLETFLPAVGQGALVIEARLGDEDIARIVSPINNLPIWQCVTAERAFLRALGGGCRAPVASLGMVNGNTLKLECMVASVTSLNMLHTSEEGTAISAEEIGMRLAEKMIGMGASEFIAEARAK